MKATHVVQGSYDPDYGASRIISCLAIRGTAETCVAPCAAPAPGQATSFTVSQMLSSYALPGSQHLSKLNCLQGHYSTYFCHSGTNLELQVWCFSSGAWGLR